MSAARTLTDADLAALLQRHTEWSLDQADPVAVRDLPATTVAKMAAEVLRLRALPVIATCGECRWCHPSEVCMHPKAHAEMEIDGCACAPPEWCPLRGRS